MSPLWSPGCFKVGAERGGIQPGAAFPDRDLLYRGSSVTADLCRFKGFQVSLGRDSPKKWLYGPPVVSVFIGNGPKLVKLGSFSTNPPSFLMDLAAAISAGVTCFGSSPRRCLICQINYVLSYDRFLVRQVLRWSS